MCQMLMNNGFSFHHWTTRPAAMSPDKKSFFTCPFRHFLKLNMGQLAPDHPFETVALTKLLNLKIRLLKARKR